MGVWNKKVLLALLAGVVLFPLRGQEIKIASVAPEQSPFGGALNQLAREWSQISDGRVRLRVYHNGVAGEEDDVLRKMRIGQLQAAVLTSVGLKQIVPEVFSVSVPFVVSSDDELEYVMEAIRPDLEARLAEQRLVVLAWSRAGWVRFFGKEPIAFPDDLRAQRLLVDASDEQMEQAFKAMGFRPIPLPGSEVLTALNSGLVDALFTTPLGAAGFQWFGLAPNMLDMEIAPLLGAIVISENAWRRVPRAMQEDLILAAERSGARIEREIARLEEEAVRTMVRFGLNVVPGSPEIEAAWREEMDENWESILRIFGPETTQRVEDLVEEYRQR
ncbi:MAG: TRAP transporter substrate-binding protein DctP [Spirochaetales bacterium]